MRSILWALTAAVLIVPCITADEIKPTPDPIGIEIHLPTVPVLIEPDSPNPPPPPDPNGPTFVSQLASDEWYVIESTGKLIVLGSPDGFVGVEMVPGPVRVRGKFSDGTGGVETRTFSSPNVYFVNPVKAGKIELMVIPVGVAAEEDIVRQPLTVMGVAPIPPPGPTPPGPKPPEPGPGPVETFRVIFVKESGSTLSAAQSAIPGAKVIREYLNAKTTKEANQPSWREYDPQQTFSTEQPNMRALWDAVLPKIQTVPCLVIEVNGKATVMPYPADTNDALKLLKQYRGD